MAGTIVAFQIQRSVQEAGRTGAYPDLSLRQRRWRGGSPDFLTQRGSCDIVADENNFPAKFVRRRRCRCAGHSRSTMMLHTPRSSSGVEIGIVDHNAEERQSLNASGHRAYKCAGMVPLRVLDGREPASAPAAACRRLQRPSWVQPPRLVPSV